MEFGYGVAEGGESATNLAVASFVQNNNVCGRGRGRFGFNDFELRDAVADFDAKIGNHLLMQRREWAIKFDLVDFGFAKFGVSHLESKIAVVGEQNQTRTVFVEPTNGF